MNQNQTGEQETQLFATADQLLEGLLALVRVHRTVSKLASQEDSPFSADIKWRQLHRLHKLNKEIAKEVAMRVATFVRHYQRNSKHSMFPRLLDRFNRVLLVNAQLFGRKQIFLEAFQSEAELYHPYLFIEDCNNNTIKQLYRRLYNADIDTRKSATMYSMTSAFNQAASRGQPTQGSASEEPIPIAKSNMMYMGAVDVLEKHVDVLQSEQFERCHEFDMTVSLTENLSKLLDGMMSRNTFAKQKISRYAIDYSDYLVRKLRASRQEAIALKRISRVTAQSKRSSGMSQISEKLVSEDQGSQAGSNWRNSNASSCSFMQQQSQPLLRKSAFAMFQVRRFAPDVRRTCSPSVRKQSSNRGSMTRSNSIKSQFGQLIASPAPCDTIKQSCEEATRLDTCLTVVGMHDRTSTTQTLHTDAKAISTNNLFNKPNRGKSTLTRLLDPDAIFLPSSHHFYCGVRKFAAATPMQQNLTTMRNRRSRMSYASQEQLSLNNLFIAVKKHVNLHNLQFEAPVLSYQDFVLVNQL